MASRGFCRAPAYGHHLRPARLQTLVCIFAALAPVTAFTHLRRYARAATLPTSGYQFQPAAFSIPHRDKRTKPGGCGEDAFFISEDKRVLGVSDGVGGWGEVGVDPSLYSRCLMTHSAQKVTASNARDPVEIMQAGYDHCTKVMGSATAVVVSLDGKNLRAANLGDSGVMVVRDDKVLLRSKEQQRGFNFPYQLGTNSEDTPKRADRYELPMQPADIVVIATDGFWDNLFDQKILQLINGWKNSNGGKVDKLAKILAEEAERVSLSRDRTPFQVAAANAGLRFNGGKEDDITVVVGVVTGPSEEQTKA
jgi:protein phosphatase PTC7